MLHNNLSAILIKRIKIDEFSEKDKKLFYKMQKENR